MTIPDSIHHLRALVNALRGPLSMLPERPRLRFPPLTDAQVVERDRYDAMAGRVDRALLRLLIEMRAVALASAGTDYPPLVRLRGYVLDAHRLQDHEGDGLVDASDRELADRHLLIWIDHIALGKGVEVARDMLTSLDEMGVL
jgi:hypothetical protein